MRIPTCIPVVPKNAKKYVNAVIDKNWISSLCLDEDVNFIKKLEDGMAGYIGTKYCISTTSGSTALDLSLATLGIEPGDEIIIPSFTMIATAHAVVHNGGRPVFVDADEETWCMDISLVEQVVTQRTRAIIPVHIYGHPEKMDEINAIASKYNLCVIEDAAEAIGTQYKGKMAGSLGDMACFSFYANKTITSGEGGLLATNNEDFAKRANMLKDQAFGVPRFIHEDIGFNYRMNNLTAAYAFASFEEVEDAVDKRRKNARLYREGLSDIEGITLPPEKDYAVNSFWMYGILIDEKRFGLSKTEVKDILKQRHGIDTRDFFYPMHKQPSLIKKGYVKDGVLMPVSEMLWERGLYLPSSTNLKEAEISCVVEAIKKINQ
ncbi:DegT/DnrJ/EryC1/StrS family aminotransferase [Thermodesulfovibrionales bacterium]|nr:DegT/DnrJ/EryC1/StrS family aminotransferase [Thermodesulfovibrionales bacterium]MCL0086899.1 DegT/DnrJ/EryC1/StrS family aminotransferase [Thermodesulfovibrionales bacterium]